MDKFDAIHLVRECTKQLAEAEKQRNDSICKALDAGVGVSMIAEAAELSRPTVYRIIREQQEANAAD